MISSRFAVGVIGLMLFGAGAAEASAKCLKATDAVAGELRKVESRRPSDRTPIWGWHLSTSEPLCISIDGSKVNDLTDLQVVFKKGVSEAKLDESLGWSIGVRGKMIYRPDDSYTGDVIVTDAVLLDDSEMNDAGEVRR